MPGHPSSCTRQGSSVTWAVWQSVSLGRRGGSPPTRKTKTEKSHIGAAAGCISPKAEEHMCQDRLDVSHDADVGSLLSPFHLLPRRQRRQARRLIRHRETLERSPPQQGTGGRKEHSATIITITIIIIIIAIAHTGSLGSLGSPTFQRWQVAVEPHRSRSRSRSVSGLGLDDASSLPRCLPALEQVATDRSDLIHLDYLSIYLSSVSIFLGSGLVNSRAAVC